MTDLMERVERDEREWRTARLHEAVHHNWLGQDECPACLAGAAMENSPYLRLTPMARDRIGYEDFLALEARAAALNCRAGAVFSARHGWFATAESAGKRVTLRAPGPLAAVLAGLLDDFEAAA